MPIASIFMSMQCQAQTTSRVATRAPLASTNLPFIDGATAALAGGLWRGRRGLPRSRKQLQAAPRP